MTRLKLKSLIEKRSIAISGRKTSMSLENAFWQALKEIAELQGRSVSQIVQEIDATTESPNLSSAVRLLSWHISETRMRR